MVDIYYRSPSIHELLVHRAAERTGAYRTNGVDVALKDGATNWGAVKDTADASIGIGGTVQAAVMGTDTRWKIVSVNTNYPPFWLVAQPDIDRIEDLAGERIMGRSSMSPPGVFTRIIFRKHGLDLLEECTYLEEKDREGIDRLRDGDVAATHASSSTLPFDAVDDGYQILAFYGNEFPTPTTGLAVNETQLDPDSDTVRNLVQAQRDALQELLVDRNLALQAISDIDSTVSEDNAARLFDEYIQPYWNQSPTENREIAAQSIQKIATELGESNHPDVEAIYDFQ